MYSYTCKTFKEKLFLITTQQFHPMSATNRIAPTTPLTTKKSSISTQSSAVDGQNDYRHL